MLSWDEFDKEDEFNNLGGGYLSLIDKTVIGGLSHLGDSPALRRAKQALDALNVAESLAALESVTFRRRYVTHHSRGKFGEPEFVSYLVTCFYDFRSDHSRKSEFFDSFSKLVSTIAAFLLSSICCSLAMIARNAVCRTPLFAYDAELCIDRHRLRTAF